VLELMNKIRSETTIFYSTHILDDVQKVSDIVAILNKGELVAQAPIEQLLAGKGNVTYRVVVKGNPENVRMNLTRLPYVSAVNIAGQNGHTALMVNVTDDAKAEDCLLEEVLSGGVKVVEFGRKKIDLEDAFMDLVEGKSNGN
jgi:ABC-2 type transport system ATP-binding protein